MLAKFFKGQKSSSSGREGALSVGLDIGSSACKMVQLKQNGANYELVNWAIASIVNADETQAVRKTLEKLDISNVSPTTAVFGKGTLTRYIEMPRMTASDLKKSFALEADKYFPFPPDQIYIDSYILDPKGKDNKMSVLVVAAKKEIIDKRIKLLTGLGLQANYISLNSVALVNVINVLGIKEIAENNKEKAKSPDAGAVAVLDMGEMESNLSISINNLPRFTRDIFLGGREMTKNISHAMGVDAAQAEKLKCASNPQSAQLLPACEAMISSLVSELRLSFDYFVTEKNIAISQLLITGGSAMLPGIEEIFAKNFEIPVKRWNPTESLALSAKIDATELSKDASRLGVAVGLALCS